MNRNLLLLITVSVLTCSAAFANKVEFSATNTDGTFYCIVNTIIPFKSVNIDTNGVEVNGFCAGEEYVTSPGHISGMSMSELKKYYFEYEKNLGKKGSVEIVATNPDDISCFAGKGENRKAYGNGKFC